MKVTLAVLGLLIVPNAGWAKVVRYELRIANQKVNVTGQDVDFALTVNGGIPAPTLEFTEGDDAEITVVNQLLDQETSIHWHGILLPPEEDGVPYVNTPPIFPGLSRTFRFRLRQHGTYWYHSHTMLQEQKGVYGAIVIHPKKEGIKADREAVAVLSDWSDENADQIVRNLRKDGDYYLYKKGTVRSFFGAASRPGGLKTYFQNEWNRMGGMDLSDVGYDAFLINGKKDSQLLMARPGERVRLRIINAGSSTYFYLALGGLKPMTVVASDGVDIEPIMAKEILIGMAETYDVLFTVPEYGSVEVRATAQDVTGTASAWIGEGPRIPVPSKEQPDLYAPMHHPEHADHNEHKEHNMQRHHPNKGSHQGVVVDTLTVDDIKSPTPTTQPVEAEVFELRLVLGGDMSRYVWHINGKSISEDRLININAGDVVRFNLENRTMMHHPIHLHGHFFRVLNKSGAFSPLKHTVDVPPMGQRTIEFYASEPGQWMLHCHNLYHMENGMARVVRYHNYALTPEQAHLDHQDHHLHDHWYQTGNLQVATNIVEGNYRLSQTWNEFDLRIHSRREEDWVGEGDIFYRRWVGNYLNFIFGGSTVNYDYRGTIGVGYILPMLIRTHLLIDNKGKLRMDLSKRFQWTSTIFTDVEYIWRQDRTLDSEGSISLMYGRFWHWAVGIRYTGETAGVGFQYQF